VRYALSSDEFIIELRGEKSSRGKHVIKRLCQTLTNTIDLSKSEVQLLKDFICVKLYKKEDEQWRDLGYDIANFTVPKVSQIKSNYLKSAEPEVPDTPSTAETEENKEEEQP